MENFIRIPGIDEDPTPHRVRKLSMYASNEWLSSIFVRYLFPVDNCLRKLDIAPAICNRNSWNYMLANLTQIEVSLLTRFLAH